MNKMYSALFPSLWLVHLTASYYFIRPIQSIRNRALLTILPCSLLTYAGCYGLPPLHMSSVVLISLYWLVSVRLTHLIVFSPNETSSFRQYAWKFLWVFLPIVPADTQYSISYYIASVIVKFLLNNWAHEWLRSCPPNDSYGRCAIFYLLICTGSYINDLQTIVIRLVTRNEYELLPFNNYPILSKSIREFWGRRYNLLINTLLKESVFNPLRHVFHSSTAIAATVAFIISGLLHAHVAVTGLGASSPWPSFLFFVLQGLAGCVTVKCPFTLPKPVGILLTHAFLLATAPLYIGLFTRAGPVYYEVNKPPLSDVAWIPRIPAPYYCPS